MGFYHGDRICQEEAPTQALRSAVLRAGQTVRFYRGYPVPENMDEFRMLPLLEPSLCASGNADFIGIDPAGIARVVSHLTSGTTGARKRIYFSGADLELTIRYFAAGMRTLMAPGEAAAICFPRGNPGGMVDLLAQGIARFGAHSCGIDVSRGDCWAGAARQLLRTEAVCAIGAPVPMLGFLEYCKLNNVRHGLKTVLLSADYAASSLIRRINNMGIEVFTHYGMTEFCYGGALECNCHDGMHVRQDDLYFEVIPKAGTPAGQGEIAVTTLEQQAMPLIRYRTGDIGRIDYSPCDCGMSSPRLFISGRDKAVSNIDEIVFGIDHVVDWRLAGGNEIVLYSLVSATGCPKELCGRTVRICTGPTPSCKAKRTISALSTASQDRFYGRRHIERGEFA